MVRLLYWLFSRPPGLSITVARPTTTDGETVQISTTVPMGASIQKIAETVEACSLAIQRRMVNQNELKARTEVEMAHEKWLRVKKKLDEAESNGRKGLGVLTKEERVWFQRHGADFDKDGPKVTAKITEAAHGPDPDES